MKTALLLLALAPTVLIGQTPRDAAAPAVATGQGVIAGTVVSDDASATPVRRAVVVLSSPDERGDRRTVTDDQGHFALGELPPGHYSLSATKAGWLTTYYGSAHPGRPAFGGATVALTAGQQIKSIALKMLHGSVIAGTVSDPFGRPEMGVEIEIATLRMQDGQRQFVSTNGILGPAGNASTTTDDRGAFRLFGLAPGDYVVVAMPGFLDNFGGGEVVQLTPDALATARRSVGTGAPGNAVGGVSNAAQPATSAPREPTVGAANIYYPGTVDLAAATVIRLNAGEERAGVDFAVQLVPTARVQGVVMGPDGQPSTTANLQLIAPASGLGGFFGNSSTRTGPDGRFQFVGVPPGPYQIVARAVDASAAPAAGRAGGGALGGGAGISTDGNVVTFNGNARAMALWASDSVSVAGQDVSGISLALQRGATVSGHVVFSGRSLEPPQDMSRMPLTLVPVADTQRQSLGPIGAQTDSSGAFHFVNVPPGRYRVGARLAPAGRLGGAPAAAASGWVLKSAMSGSVDAVDQAIDVTLAGSAADLVVTFVEKLGEIDGAVRNAAGQPVTDYRIVVFSADKAMWGTTGRRMRAPVQTEPDGTFRVEGLPAGQYFLAAVTDMDQDDLNNLAFLDDLASHAIPIALADGEKKVQEIKVAR